MSERKGNELSGMNSVGHDRRRFFSTCLVGGAGISALYHTPGLFAEELTITPAMTEGPFYPDRLPLDTDNDLLIINDSITPAVGTVTHLSGRVLTKAGTPVRNALVEIWQVDNTAAYLHSRGHQAGKNDENFQGYGRFFTDSTGQYYFRTIRPVKYGEGPGARAPHIHFAISKGGKRILTTQLLIDGDAHNDQDGVLKSISDARLRKSILAEFQPLADSTIGELGAKFDIVLGYTAEEIEHNRFDRPRR